jgi:3'-phosphoadenosine 5'-phosphosulfate sulfotransferase (PAPS reductase)/FAD synthetase
MTLNTKRIPILAASVQEDKFSNVEAAIDGFRSVEEILQSRPSEEHESIVAALETLAARGAILWRDDWSSLRWCRLCNVPLLQESCSRCGAEADHAIELKFPCNPRPLMPHDEEVFRKAGLPWRVDSSLVVNSYARPDFLGWELIRSGEHIGDIVMMEGSGAVKFQPSSRFRSGFLQFRDGQPATMQDVVDANLRRLERIEQEAVAFIREWCGKRLFTVPVAAFSGGKDSAVLAHLCFRSGVRMRIVQIDTGIDPPQTRAYSERYLAQFDNLKHRRMENREIFWRALGKLGPPARDFQWCRTILKNAAPYRTGMPRFAGFLKLLGLLLRLRIVMIEGARRREEEWRIALNRIVTIPGSPVETIALRPILDFTDLDIWMYVHRHRLEMNPTYSGERHQRLICLFCPEKDRHEYEVLKRLYPEMWARFEAALIPWQEFLGFPLEWVSQQLWRHEKPISSCMRELGIGSRVDRIGERLNSLVEFFGIEAQPGRFRARGKVRTSLEVRGFGRWLSLLGRTSISRARGEILVRNAQGCLRVGRSGDVLIEGTRRDAVERLANLFHHYSVSYLNCIGCGLCRSVLPGIKLEKERAAMPIVVGADAEAAHRIVDLCPMNAIGLRRSIALRQDG